MRSKSSDCSSPWIWVNDLSLQDRGVVSMNPAGIVYLINEEEAAASSFMMAVRSVTDMGVVSWWLTPPPSLPLLPRSLSSFWRLWKLTCRYTCRPAWQWRAAMPEKTQKKTSERVSVAPVDWWPRRRVRGPRWSPDETDGEDLICPAEHSDSNPPPHFILYIRGIKEVLGYSSERITTVTLYKRGKTKFLSIKWSWPLRYMEMNSLNVCECHWSLPAAAAADKTNNWIGTRT